jgi:hypothetical protein
MRRTTLSATHRAILAAAMTLASTVAAADPQPSKGTTARDAFERLKTLAGDWSGTSKDGAPMVIQYRVQAGGTTIVETQAPGTAEEMLTVYSVDGGELVLTHYCPMGHHGNQPHMKLDAAASGANELVFTFTGGTNLDPSKDMHVHGGRLIFDPDGRLRRVWDIVNDGKPAGRVEFTLARKDAPSAQPAAAEVAPEEVVTPVPVDRRGPARGTKIPAFRASDQHGAARDFGSLTGPKGLVLLFVRSADW